jgi:molybdenum cofactor cytidylyltransferase
MSRAPLRPFVSGVVLAGGGSRRLGQPKQLLPFASGTLLGHVLATVGEHPFDQRVVALGAGAEEVRRQVDLSGWEIAVAEDHGAGCSSSIAAALALLDERCDVLVLLLGDQPGVGPGAIARLLAGRGDAPLAVCRYQDGRGHPFAFAAALFGELAGLHGDKAVWKLLDRHATQVAEVPVSGPVPRDVDTWADYEALLA